MAKISVLIPVLNGAAFLDEAMASLEAQSFKDFQVLVWENGSTDETLEYLRRWIPHRLPGRIYTGEPLSLGLSLRRLVEVADTEWCARMDADDVCQPLRFEKQMAFLHEHPELAMAGTDRDYIDMEGKPLSEYSALPYTASDVLHATLIGPRIWHPTVIFKREAVMAAGNYQDQSTPEQPYWSEDYDLWMRFQTKHLAATMPDRLLKYRLNPDGVTQQAIRDKRAAVARRAVWELHGQAFTGLTSPENALRLYDRRSSFALPSFVRIARHFQRLDHVSVAERMRMRSFIGACQKLTARKDIVTRTALKLLMRKATPSQDSR